ncbi:MAG: hypothetical protein OEM83_06510 [Gammaproteobacteria bacterium]|nr:hypothetical protein [Gammaproteobacteria bacterium]
MNAKLMLMHKALVLTSILGIILFGLGNASNAQGAAPDVFRVAFGTAHNFISSNNERVSTNIRIWNRSPDSPIIILNVEVIERSTGSDVINLASTNCIFNPSGGTGFIAPLPFTLQPLGAGLSSVGFRVNRCLEGVPRKGSTADAANARYVAGFVTVVTVQARKENHIG